MTTEAMVESTAFVEVTDERIEDHIEQKSADGCKQCPFEDLFLIGLLVDFTDFVCDQSCDEADAEF